MEMTSPDHSSGTDRVAEVAARRPEADVVVNVQGDLPFISAGTLEALVTPYVEGASPLMTTVGCRIASDAVFHDPNAVKVLLDRRGNAIYFSRSPIPYMRNLGDAPVLHHLGVYAFTRDFLLRFATLERTPLEHCEALEQLRALEHGYDIHVRVADEPAIEVNTPEDLDHARAVMAIERRASRR